MHRVRHTYRPGEPLLAWLYAIARHVRVDHYRRRRRVSAHEVAIEGVAEPAAPVEARSAIARFDALIGILPASQREVVTMLKVAGLSVEEVARATSSTVGAVKQKAHRAYERLRGLLQAEDVT